MITPVFCFSDDNIDRLHKNLMKAIVGKGKDLKFGDKDEIKMARECHFTVQVYSKGIKRLLDGKVPKGVDFKGEMIKELQNSFLEEDTNPNNFEYSYPQLLKEWPRTGYAGEDVFPDEYSDIVYDQMEMAKDILMIDKQNDIQSNRNVGSLLHPYMNDVIDGKIMSEKPCFNWFQIRYNGNNMVSLRHLFRSHCYIRGIWPNLCCLSKAFDELVVKPCGCKIEEIILTSTSGHAYENDSQDAESISGIPWEREKTRMPDVQG